MDYIIKFDNREKELIKILENKGYNTTLENLDLGDIQFLDLMSKEVLIIIERKTLSDLSSSIKDGRYKEQKERLLHSMKSKVRKIMLIEGDNFDNFNMSKQTFNSVIINTMIRDNIHVHLSKNKDETIEFIENIIIQLPKYLEDLQKEIIHNETKTYTNEFSCKTSKKGNLTGDVCFRNMLSQIPGVSTNIATAYVSKYKNMNNFIKIINENNSNKILADEKYGANNRRVGDKVADKIINFLTFLTSDDSNVVNVVNQKQTSLFV